MQTNLLRLSGAHLHQAQWYGVQLRYGIFALSGRFCYSCTCKGPVREEMSPGEKFHKFLFSTVADPGFWSGGQHRKKFTIQNFRTPSLKMTSSQRKNQGSGGQRWKCPPPFWIRQWFSSLHDIMPVQLIQSLNRFSFLFSYIEGTKNVAQFSTKNFQLLEWYHVVCTFLLFCLELLAIKSSDFQLCPVLRSAGEACPQAQGCLPYNKSRRCEFIFFTFYVKSEIWYCEFTWGILNIKRFFFPNLIAIICSTSCVVLVSLEIPGFQGLRNTTICCLFSFLSFLQDFFKRSSNWSAPGDIFTRVLLAWDPLTWKLNLKLKNFWT